MDFKLFAVVFGTVFVAEIGDKTQLATLLFASGATHPKWTVFIAASAALVVAAALAVLAGAFLSQHFSERMLARVAGLGFIFVGLWTLLRA